MTDEMPVIPPKRELGTWTVEPPPAQPPAPGTTVYGIVPVFIDGAGNRLGAHQLGAGSPPPLNCAVSYEADAVNAAMMGHPLRRSGGRSLSTVG
jgi:hypothetical protein